MYDSLFTFDKLLLAAHQCSLGRRGKQYVYEFNLNLGQNLTQLRDELLSRSYRPRPCREFVRWCVCGQKYRVIRAPHFRDTVVQRAVYNALYPVFEKTFIYDSYGCRLGKGAQRAADRVQSFIRASAPGSYYLQTDIRKYYYSVDHTILHDRLARRIDDPDLLDLCLKFCDTPTPGRGMNVGSLIAQLYGLIYLDRFDQFCKRVLKLKQYARYVDDTVTVGLSKSQAVNTLHAMAEFLGRELRLSLSHWSIQPISRGINFVGYRTWPDLRLIRKRSLRTFRQRLICGKFPAMESILAHSEHTASYRGLMRQLTAVYPLPKFLQRRLKRWQKSIHLNVS